MSDSSYLIRCMFGDTAVGGTADVYVFTGLAPAKLETEAAAILLTEPSVQVQVFVAGSNGQYRAESYSPKGERIQFCGHGALAAAWVMLHEFEPQAASLQFSNADRQWQAKRSAHASSHIALSYQAPVAQACKVPDFASAVLGVQPLAAAEFGGPGDYLVVELNDAALVQVLRPDLAALAAATQRALILTARGSSGECVFRYFAPQYGNPEDAATGSAAVQLAAYWLQPEDSEPLLLRQLSSQGAEMQVSYQGDAVDLAARVGYR